MGMQPTVTLAICFLTTFIIKYSNGRTPPDENPVTPIGVKEGVCPASAPAIAVCLTLTRWPLAQ